MIGVESARNLLVESVNARDPDLLRQSDVPDVDTLIETIRTMNERWPRMMLTRGELGAAPVAAVWMPDANERYRRVGHVVVQPEEDGAHVEMVPDPDPDLVAEEPPGRTVAEWESAVEVDEGDGRWI